MDEPAEGAKAFEARLAALKKRMEAGLGQRAAELRASCAALSAGGESARELLGSHAHRLRGIAGTYGYQNLTDQAALLEKACKSEAADAEVVRLAHILADLAEDIGRGVGPISSHPPGAEESGKSASTRPKSALGRLRILVIDDDAFVRRLLGRVLQELAGFDVTLVASAQKGLLSLQNGTFDIIISDALMPDMNGRAFYTAVRDLGGVYAVIPVMILSAATLEDLGWEGVLDENTGWICKPFQPDELVEQVVELVDRASGASSSRT